MSFQADIDISVQTQFLEQESEPQSKRYVFAYTIEITNHSIEAIQLLNRYWKITDANNQVQEVTGEGVVGKQPEIQPGQSFSYSSGAVLETSAGMMEGHYEFINNDQQRFQAAIPAFALIDPRQLH